jgi:hypothetical protein
VADDDDSVVVVVVDVVVVVVVFDNDDDDDDVDDDVDVIDVDVIDIDVVDVFVVVAVDNDVAVVFVVFISMAADQHKLGGVDEDIFLQVDAEPMTGIKRFIIVFVFIGCQCSADCNFLDWPIPIHGCFDLTTSDF